MIFKNKFVTHCKIKLFLNKSTAVSWCSPDFMLFARLHSSRVRSKSHVNFTYDELTNISLSQKKVKNVALNCSLEQQNF